MQALKGTREEEDLRNGEEYIATYKGRREVSAEKFIKEMSFIKRKAG
jgi:hypothetical protein